MPLIELINATDYVFTDISSEAFRTYVFEEGETVYIDQPVWLSVSENGHRILDIHGVSHYIPVGWLHLYWEAKDGMPHFVK
jgi:hypothetical protein